MPWISATRPHRAGAYALAFLFALVVAPDTARAAVTDVLGALPSSDFSAYIAPQSYRDWGNEPCVAVNPANPLQMVISSFGYGSWISDNTAQLWYSTNGGASWAIEFAVPTPIAGDDFFVDDQTYAYDSSGTLHCAMLVADNSGNLYVDHGSTANVLSSAAWTWNASPVGSVNVDQPWIAVKAGKVAVAYDNFDPSFSLSEERVAISTDNGASFPAPLNQAVASPGRVTTSFVNPGLRIAMDNGGEVFSICGVRTNNNASGVPLVHYRLNRYSAGPNWDFSAASADTIGGVAITNGASRQGNNAAFSFGGINDLIGNITAIAPNADGSRVYVAYGLSDASGIGHLYLQKLVASGTNLIMNTSPLMFSSPANSAALPSVAVAADGAVGMQFYEFDGTIFHAHIAVSVDEGASVAANTDLYDWSTNGMVLGNGTTSSHNRLLGDYQTMVASGNTFYGVFAGRGNVASGAVNTTNLIVPLFYAMNVPNPPGIDDIARLGDRNVRIDFAGTPNQTYLVEAATNLLSPIAWRTVSTNIAGTNGLWSYTDFTATNHPQQFYRGALP